MEADAINAVRAVLEQLDRIATALEKIEGMFRTDDRVQVALESLVEEGLAVRGKIST